jgi:serine/threonine protein kinase
LYSRKDELWKIGDFGISTTGSSQAQTTRRGRGTSGYRSPELIGSQKQTFTNKVDIWALGCILYRLAYDSKLFQDDFAVREWSIVSAPLPFSIDGPISDNSAENRADVSSIQNLISSMLLRQPEGRPSATELLSSFTAAAKSSVNLPFPNQENSNVLQEILDGSGLGRGIIGVNGRSLLIWVGDEPFYNVEEIHYALGIGVAVKILYSPVEAMNWASQNWGISEPP